MTDSLTRARTSTDSTIGFRRGGAAVALPLSFGLQLVCNSIYLIVQSESGLNDTGTSAEALEMIARYPTQYTAMSLLAFAGSLLLIPGALAALRVLRPAKPRLALWAVVSLIAGYAVYGGTALGNGDAVGLAVAGLGPDVAGALDTNPYGAAFMAPMVLFLWGNLGGPILLGLAIILSRTFPWYVGALIMSWSVLHPIGLVLGTEGGAVIGGVLQVCGCLFIAARALRTPNREWAARG